MSEEIWDILKLLLAGGVGAAILPLATEGLNILHGRRDRRYAIYDDLRKSFDENSIYAPIFKSLDLIDGTEAEIEKGKKKLAEINDSLRHGFLAMLERIALVWRSDILPVSVLNYNFGHYTILAYDTIELWPNGLEDRDHEYYASLADFVQTLRLEREKLRANRAAYIRTVRLR
jgi:hypothetical protein